MNIAALVSGGVDSSVIVPLLKDMGFDPHIFYIKIGLEGKDDLMDCPAEEDIEITTFIAKKYAIGLSTGSTCLSAFRFASPSFCKLGISNSSTV